MELNNYGFKPDQFKKMEEEANREQLNLDFLINSSEESIEQAQLEDLLDKSEDRLIVEF